MMAHKSLHAREDFDGAARHLATQGAAGRGRGCGGFRPGATRAGAGPAGGGHHAGADRGRHQGRPGQPLHRHGDRHGRAVLQDLRGEISGHLGQGRALGGGAHLLAHRPGICLAHLQCRRRQHHGCRARAGLEARRPARCLPSGGRGPALRAGTSRPRRHLRHASGAVQRHRLQHPAGEAAGRPDRLRRPARAEMDRAAW